METKYRQFGIFAVCTNGRGSKDSGRGKIKSLCFSVTSVVKNQPYKIAFVSVNITIGFIDKPK
jgi:hypothetical protein